MATPDAPPAAETTEPAPPRIDPVPPLGEPAPPRLDPVPASARPTPPRIDPVPPLGEPAPPLCQRAVRAASPSYRRWLGRAPRAPRVRTAIALAVAAALLPVLGPWCWSFADRELGAIDRKRATRHGRPWIAAALAIGIGATFFAITALAFTASFTLARAR